MTDPKYDEDNVNLGYLKRIIEETETNIKDNIDAEYSDVSRHFATKPQPPYHKGDTWIDGNIVYTCIKDREIGTYNDDDWVTESGAKEEAEKKNKIFLTQPSNYDAGDMWILQTDTDHKSGKKGEILITTVGRADYNEDDWVNMLSYGSIASINEVANNLNEAIGRIDGVEEAIEDGIIITFYQNTIPEAKHIGDLWYVTENIETYIKGKLYRYDGESWQLLDDPAITEAFEEANEARLIADGKIQSFYSETEPTEEMGVGDLWIDTSDNNKLHRYNGTEWVAVYDTRVDEVIENVETITERTAEISTDLGVIEQTVSETETRLNNDYMNTEQIEAETETLKEDINLIKEQTTTVTTTAQGLQIQIDEINNNGVKVVKNTTVDIDEDGVTVGKADSEFSTTMSNTGTYMYSYDKQIAKYDKDGAEMYNLTVQNEAVIGNLRCLSTTANGEKRTHIHWIGG